MQAVTWQIMATVALLSSLFSLVCSFHLGYEVLFITAMVLKGVGMPADQAYSVVVLLPLLNGAGILVDAAVSALGSAYSSRLLKPYEPVAFRDKI
jgi:hypothetical protein